MSAPQPAVVHRAPPPPPVVVMVPSRSLAGELTRWSTRGILIGMPAGIVLGFAFGLFGPSGFFLGIAAGGLLGLAIAGVLARTRDTARGYGSTKRISHAGAISTWVHVSGLVASIAVGAIGFASVGFGFAGWGALAVAGAVGILSAILLLFGAAFSPERDFARTTALVVGPILAILSLGMFAFSSAMAGDRDDNAGAFVHPADPDPQIVDTAPPPFGAPDEGELTPSDRIPAPALLVSDEWDLAALLDLLADAADRSLEVAVVDDPDIQTNVRFLPVAVYCQWEQFAPQVTIDIWFDTADDAAAMLRVRDYWLANGYQLVADDSDLIVVNGVDGLLGAQYSLEKTWDDELRLRMQTVCSSN